jgi:hypothetical protein
MKAVGYLVRHHRFDVRTIPLDGRNNAWLVQSICVPVVKGTNNRIFTDRTLVN